MSGSAIEIGERLHIITRRIFDGDIRRHFAGEVTAISGELCEVRGYAFVLNPGVNKYEKRPEIPTLFRIVADMEQLIAAVHRELAGR